MLKFCVCAFLIFQLWQIFVCSMSIRSNQEIARKEITDSIKLCKSVFFGFALYNMQIKKLLAIESVSTSINSNFLLERVSSLDCSSYKPGIQIDDIHFPIWFNGQWKTNSVFSDISTPLGVEVIGGKPVYDRAIKDLNTNLEYISRFKADLKGDIIFDRYFNVKQIAEASMGPNSVISDEEINSKPAELLEIVLVPNAVKDRVFKVKLASSDRIQSQSNDSSFEVMERTKQTIITTIVSNDTTTTTSVSSNRSSNNNNVSGAALEKDIETITVYNLVSDNYITAVQRTATFFSPKDPRYALALAREPRVVNQAIDVRYYKITMKRIQDQGEM